MSLLRETAADLKWALPLTVLGAGSVVSMVWGLVFGPWPLTLPGLVVLAGLLWLATSGPGAKEEKDEED